MTNASCFLAGVLGLSAATFFACNDNSKSSKSTTGDAGAKKDSGSAKADSGASKGETASCEGSATTTANTAAV